MVKVSPAAVIEPVLAGPVVGLTLKVTVPLPVAFVPAVMVTHEGLSLTAFQAHADWVFTVKL